MGTTDSNGIWFWDENDIFAPVHTALNLGSSATSAALATFRESIAPNIIHVVANRVEATDLATSVEVSVDKPLYVHRKDATAAARLEVTTDGVNWLTIGSEVKGNLSALSGYAAHTRGTPRWVRRGNEVRLYGSVARTASLGAFSPGSPFGVCTMPPAEHRPPAGTQLGTVAGFSGVGWARYDGGNELKILYATSGTMPTGSNPWFVCFDGSVGWSL